MALKIRQRLNKVPLQVALRIPFVMNVLLEQFLVVKIIQLKGENAGCTIGAGSQNKIKNSPFATIVSGNKNSIKNSNVGTIAGGEENQVTGNFDVVGGGLKNIASGDGSVIPDGRKNKANGDFSIAFGCSAEAKDDRSLVIAFQESGGTLKSN